MPTALQSQFMLVSANCFRYEVDHDGAVTESYTRPPTKADKEEAALKIPEALAEIRAEVDERGRVRGTEE